MSSIQSDRQIVALPYSQRDCRSGKGDFGGAGWGGLSEQTERRDAKPAPVTASAFGGGLRYRGMGSIQRDRQNVENPLAL